MPVGKTNRTTTQFWIAVLVITTLAIGFLWRTEACPVNNPTTWLTIGNAGLSVEVAANTTSRACGLAFRDRLPNGHGMLFVYKERRNLEFWMKETRIPLALAYIGDDRKIHEILSMHPDTELRVYRSQQAVRFALETNPGWFASNGISVGDTVDFSLPDGLKVD